MYEGAVIELPFGKAGQTARVNRLLAQSDELLSAQGVTFEDTTLRKEAGASLYDSAGLSGAPNATAGLGTSNQWAGALTTYAGSAPAWVKLVGSNTSTSVGATVALTVAAGGVTAGQSIIVTVGAFTAGSLSVTSITDTAGNVYVQQTSKIGTGPFVATWACHNCLALSAGDTITVTISSAGLERGAVANAYSGLNAAPLDRTATASGNNTNFAVPSSMSLSSVPELIIGSGACADVGPAVVTATNGFTKSGDVNTGTGGNHIRVWQEYRVDSTSPTIIAAHDWWKDPTTQRLVIAALDGGVYMDDNAGNIDATTLLAAATLSTTARPGLFVRAGQEAAANNRKLFYFNGTNPVKVLSANTSPMTTIASPPADWTGTHQPVGAVVHNLRLWGFGNDNFPHALYYSLASNHEDFLTATGSDVTGQVWFNSSIGDRIYSAVSFNGVLWVWKYPVGIGYLDDSDATVWFMRVKSANLGCAATPYAVLPMDDDVMFLSANGEFHLLSAVNTLGGTRASDLSYALGLSNWLRTNVNLSRLSQALSIWYPDKKVALWSLPGTGSTVNNLLLKFDAGLVAQGGPWRFAYSSRDTVDAIAMRRGSDTVRRPIFGTGGYIYLMEQSDRSKDTAGYAGAWQTPHHDLSHVDPKMRRVRKLFEHLEFIMEPVAAGTMTVTVYVDGTAKGQTITVDCTKRRQKFALHVGDGHTISVAGTSSTAVSDDFQLLAILVYFKPGNEDTSR